MYNLTHPSLIVAAKDLKDFIAIKDKLDFRGNDGVLGRVLSLTEARFWGLSRTISSFNRAHIEGKAFNDYFHLLHVPTRSKDSHMHTRG